MIRVLFDPEIFALQNHGGIPRLFKGLYLEFKNNPHHGIDPIVPKGPWFPYETSFSLPAREWATSRIYKLLLSQLAVWHNLRGIDLIQETYYTKGRYLGTKPRVVTIHDLIPEQADVSLSRFSFAVDKRPRVRRASALITDSLATQKLVESEFKEGQKSKMIYPGLDFAEQISAPKHTKRADSFLYVGTRDGHKDFKTLWSAAHILAKQGIALQIQAVGGGPLRQHEMAADERISIVQVEADDEELQSLYAQTAATVVTSTNEGFGYPLLESFSHGTEVICSDIPIFIETSCGLANFFEASNSHSLARLLLEFINGSAESLHMPDRPSRLRRIAAGYTWSECAAQYANLYKTLVPATA
jgi:glycosyltransferase involved in cell wall biosynthesis